MSSSLHVAIIMDGNGRWATARGLPRLAGHRRGADALRRTVEAAPDLGITTITFYAFSSDNWRRPPDEVRGLMTLLRVYLNNEVDRCIRNGVRFSMIGRRDRLRPDLVRAIESAEACTAAGETLHMRVAIDYSSRDQILAAAANCTTLSREEMTRILGPDVDLLIRTGGEQRLSDYLLWECAYAEFLFLDRMWPDFSRSDLESAVRYFQQRERRFGGLVQAVGDKVVTI